MQILQLAEEDFCTKDVYTQSLLLLNIIKAFQCNASKVDVSNLCYIDDKGNKKKGGANQCAITKNGDITSEKRLKLVLQSMSGLKEKHINLSLDNK